MCIIVYKPSGKDMPTKKILKGCFERNPDGAGYMFSGKIDNKEKVEIHKGFMDFKSFYKSLMKDYSENDGKNKPFVLHFRISTQAGVNQACTHPYPLSRNMEDLKKLDLYCGMGVAHNGIISLTSERYNGEYKKVNGKYQWVSGKQIDYNDTMKFITEYLSLIIQDYNFYKNEDNIELIEKLIEYSNRLAILDKYGHCTLIGSWLEEDGIFYSNSTYKYDKYSYSYSGSSVLKEILEDNDNLTKKEVRTADKKDNPDEWSALTSDQIEYFEKFYDEKTGEYKFMDYDCPYIKNGDYSYCEYCQSYFDCWGNSGVLNGGSSFNKEEMED